MASDSVDVGNDMGLEPADLAHLPGAPFIQAEVDAAVVTVRNAAKWHIAPEWEETCVLDVACMEPVLRPPTRHLVSVIEIRDADTDTVIPASRYRVSTDLSQIMHRWGYWPAGYGRVEVDMVHGWETVPADLLPVIAEAAARARRDQTAKQMAAGPLSVAYDVSLGSGDVNPLSSSSVFDRYRLWQPGIA